jgi:hypothetical protein
MLPAWTRLSNYLAGSDISAFRRYPKVTLFERMTFLSAAFLTRRISSGPRASVVK